tara:strand:+ start:39997 stop:40668 length:672 start_codon:yes stop_codon:yes gene_type:complete
MPQLEKVIGKKSYKISKEELDAFVADYNKVHIDLGTGDGLFAWRLAKEEEKTAVIGVDAARESLKEGSARAAKKPARGGAPNSIFLCANVLKLDDSFNNMADVLSVNFPWGTLLQAVSIPFDDFIEKMACILKDGARLNQYINMHVFNDEDQRKALGLPVLDEDYLANILFPVYEKFGLEVQGHHFIPAGQKTEVASTWGGRLTRRSSRPTLVFSCIKKESSK